MRPARSEHRLGELTGENVRWGQGDRAEPPSGTEILRREHADGSPELVVRRTHYGYEIDGHDVARVHVRDGEILVRPFEPELAGAAEDLLTHYILPQLRQLRGVPAIHASAVALGGKVVAFMGRSGMGKSTLATSFSERAPFVTDDALLLEPTGERVVVSPMRARSRLRADSMEKLAPSANGRELGGKSEIDLVGPERPLPLARLYALDRADRITITPLTARDAVLTLATHLHRIDPSDHALLSKEVDFLEAVVRRVRVAKLAYPRSYAALPEVHHAIERDLEEP